MTYNVFGGTLNFDQPNLINQPGTKPIQRTKKKRREKRERCEFTCIDVVL